MGALKNLTPHGTGTIFTIGPGNPYVGCQVTCTWLRPWGKHPPGFTVTGTLLRTFIVRGRTCIGEIRTPTGKRIPCPWSRNFLSVSVGGDDHDHS